MGLSTTPTKQVLADALGVSIRMIGTYTADGMPRDSVEAALAWKAANQTMNGHGGKWDRATRDTGDATSPASGEDWDGLSAGEVVARLLRELAKAKTKTDVGTVEIKAKALERLLELQSRSDDLIAVADVRAAWSGHILTARGRLDAMAARGADEILAATGLAPDQRGKVFAILDRLVREAEGELARDPMGGDDPAEDEEEPD